jgi:hypothetical protein
MRRAISAVLAMCGVALALPVAGGAQHVPVPGPTSSPLPSCSVVCYYVSAADGSDSNDGLTPQTAFATLDKASSVVVAGATVYAMSGTYSAWDASGSTLTIAAAGTSSAWISFVAYPGQHPVISVYPHAWDGIHVISPAAYILIDGFEIAGLRTSVDPKKARRDRGRDGLYNENCVYLDGVSNGGSTVHHIVVRNTYVHDCTGAGIGGNGTDYVTVDNNIAAFNAYYSAYAESGITLYHESDVDDVTTYKTYVVANLSYGNREYEPFIDSHPPAITDGNAVIIDDNLHTQDNGVPYGGRTYVANNIVYGNGGRGIHIYSSQHVDAVNNTAYLDMRTPVIKDGELDAASSNDVNIVNSIGVAEKSKDVDTGYGDSSSVVYDYNVYFGTKKIPVRGPHDVVADPLFLNPSGGNFGVQYSSPAYHSGTDALAPTIDFYGTLRPQGAVDRGAVQS